MEGICLDFVRWILICWDLAILYAKNSEKMAKLLILEKSSLFTTIKNKKKAKIKRIKYKSNRAIIFNSNLFHATDKFIFKKKYESRRINITLLYGQRERGEQFE